MFNSGIVCGRYSGIARGRYSGIGRWIVFFLILGSMLYSSDIYS